MTNKFQHSAGKGRRYGTNGVAEGTGNQENNIVTPAGMHNEEGGRDYDGINRQPGWDYFRDVFARTWTYPSNETAASPEELKRKLFRYLSYWFQSVQTHKYR